MGVLETSRLILRPFRDDDVNLLAELMANPDFMRFSSGPFSREKTESFLDKVIGWQSAGRPSPFAVTIKPNGTLIGYCGFLHQQVDGKDEVEIGYRLSPEFWNQGLATEAAVAVRDHGFHDLKLPRVISLIHPDNAPSRRVADKNGMKLEKETTFKGSPAQVFALSRPQWLAMNAV